MKNPITTSMKLEIPNRMARRHAAAAFTLMFAANALIGHIASAADVTLNATNSASQTSWNTSLNWSNGSAPAGGNDYFVNSARTLRTPEESVGSTFAGDSLTVSGSGVVLVKTQTTGLIITVDDLRLDNGIVRNGGNTGGSTNTVTWAGNVTLLSGGGRFDVSSGFPNRPMIISAAIGGSGPLTLNSDAGAGYS